MDCPKCHHRLQPKEYENITVTACPDCAGIWLAPEQLSQIITLREEDFTKKEITDTLKSAHAGITAAANSNTLLCPVCNHAMNEVNYDYSSGVIINVCPEGDGLWFDKDELDKVQIFVEHWEDETRIHEKELRSKLNEIRVAENTEDTQEDNAEAVRVKKLSQKTILDRVFQLFHLLKMNK